MFVVRVGREAKGKGLYLRCEPKRGAGGLILLGGGSQGFWQRSQRRATRFKTPEKAKLAAYRMWVGNDFRIVRLTGRKLSKSIRLERAGWVSALNEVSSALQFLRRHAMSQGETDSIAGYNAALDDVAQKLGTLMRAT